MHPEIIRYKNRLDHLFEKSREYSDDPEMQAHWARYLCVLISGFLEVSVRITLNSYSLSRSHDNVSNYVGAKLKLFKSPSMSNIIQLVGLFNGEWAEVISLETEGELKAAVDSIVNNRHQIAHGKDIGLSLVQISEFYQRSIRVIEILHENCQ